MIRPYGIIPAMVTPLHQDETLNENALRRLVNYLIEAGVHGLFALGSQGEFWAFDPAEKRRILEIVVDEAEGVNQLQCRRRRPRVVAATAHRLAGEQRQRRSQALAAPQHRVDHGLSQRRGRVDRLQTPGEVEVDLFHECGQEGRCAFGLCRRLGHGRIVTAITIRGAGSRLRRRRWHMMAAMSALRGDLAMLIERGGLIMLPLLALIFCAM